MDDLVQQNFQLGIYILQAQTPNDSGRCCRTLTARFRISCMSSTQIASCQWMSDSTWLSGLKIRTGEASLGIAMKRVISFSWVPSILETPGRGREGLKIVPVLQTNSSLFFLVPRQEAALGNDAAMANMLFFHF